MMNEKTNQEFYDLYSTLLTCGKVKDQSDEAGEGSVRYETWRWSKLSNER
jgi:hypothetical protein